MVNFLALTNDFWFSGWASPPLGDGDNLHSGNKPTTSSAASSSFQTLDAFLLDEITLALTADLSDLQIDSAHALSPEESAPEEQDHRRPPESTLSREKMDASRQAWVKASAAKRDELLHTFLMQQTERIPSITEPQPDTATTRFIRSASQSASRFSSASTSPNSSIAYPGPTQDDILAGGSSPLKAHRRRSSLTSFSEDFNGLSVSLSNARPRSPSATSHNSTHSVPNMRPPPSTVPPLNTAIPSPLRASVLGQGNRLLVPTASAPISRHGSTEGISSSVPTTLHSPLSPERRYRTQLAQNVGIWEKDPSIQSKCKICGRCFTKVRKYCTSCGAPLTHAPGAASPTSSLHSTVSDTSSAQFSVIAPSMFGIEMEVLPPSSLRSQPPAIAHSENLLIRSVSMPTNPPIASLSEHRDEALSPIQEGREISREVSLVSTPVNGNRNSAISTGDLHDQPSQPGIESSPEVFIPSATNPESSFSITSTGSVNVGDSEVRQLKLCRVGDRGFTVRVHVWP